VPRYERDRYLADDLAWARRAVLDGALSTDVERALFAAGQPGSE